MAIVRRANEQQQSNWTPVPEGVWRWQVGTPDVELSEKYGNYRVKFPLTLTETERRRLAEEHGDAPEGWQQSWRTSYSVGLSLGFFKNGQYQTTKLVDFLASCFGNKNIKRFREWIAQGGGPEDTESLESVKAWLGWWQELELYGSVTHAADTADPTRVFSRFGGPLAIGAMPGQPDQEYQAFGLGKLRAMMAEQSVEPVEVPRRESAPMPQSAAVAVAAGRSYEEVFGDGSEDAPF